MKKYIVIHKDGSTEIINAQSAVKDAIAEGNIVINEEFEVLNPVLLTPDCDGKFAILSSESVPYSISYYPHLEKGYAISGYYFDCFGHTRGLPTNPISEDIRVINVIHDHIPKELFINLLKKLDSLSDRDVIATFNTLSKLLKSK